MRNSLRALKAWSHQPTLTPIDADSSVRTSLFSLCYCLLRQNPSLLSVLLATVINRMQAMAPVWRSSYPIYAGGAWSRLSDQMPHSVIIRYMQNGYDTKVTTLRIIFLVFYVFYVSFRTSRKPPYYNSIRITELASVGVQSIVGS